MHTSFFCVFFLITGFLVSCRPAEKPPAQTSQQLAQTYCGGCHLYPEPNLLDKKTWQNGVLPKMALRLGYLSDTNNIAQYGEQLEEQQRGIKAGWLPSRPVLSRIDWLRIVDFYIGNAPEKPASQTSREPIVPGLNLFVAHWPQKRLIPLTTFVSYDVVARQIMVGNRLGQVFWLDSRLKVCDSLSVGSAVSDIHRQADGQYNFLTMGLMDPSDRNRGNLIVSDLRQKNILPKLIDLHRPVQVTEGDFDRDGRSDVVVCQFGFNTGRLSLYRNLPTGFREDTLDAVPGARCALVTDANADGWPDMLALLTQGNEQVALYLNKKNGTFEKQTLLRFPSVYGSSFLELADMNGDGHPDLIYANGDNADYSYSLKAFHGVRIFLNDGHFRFKQTWFYPMHGATQAIARDFDQDGDIDIAAIAFFPNFDHQPLENFLYFENIGGLRFRPHTLPEAQKGRWLVMNAADIDHDGDDDLLLGSFIHSVTPVPKHWQQQWIKTNGLLVLKNKRRETPRF
jgi:hypothetical protein